MSTRGCMEEGVTHCTCACGCEEGKGYTQGFEARDQEKATHKKAQMEKEIRKRMHTRLFPCLDVYIDALIFGREGSKRSDKG